MATVGRGVANLDLQQSKKKSLGAAQQINSDVEHSDVKG
jgi:hypothetical protein